jgi:hypothetical protein
MDRSGDDVSETLSRVIASLFPLLGRRSISRSLSRASQMPHLVPLVSTLDSRGPIADTVSKTSSPPPNRSVSDGPRHGIPAHPILLLPAVFRLPWSHELVTELSHHVLALTTQSLRHEPPDQPAAGLVSNSLSESTIHEYIHDGRSSIAAGESGAPKRERKALLQGIFQPTYSGSQYLLSTVPKLWMRHRQL